MTIYEQILAKAIAGDVPVIPVNDDFFEYIQEQGYPDESELDISELAELWEDWLKEECE